MKFITVLVLISALYSSQVFALLHCEANINGTTIPMFKNANDIFVGNSGDFEFSASDKKIGHFGPGAFITNNREKIEIAFDLELRKESDLSDFLFQSNLMDKRIYIYCN